MGKLSMHEKATLGLVIIAIILLVISCCPGGYEGATGILQGIATGLLSGIVILLITGIKSKEYKKLTAVYEVMHESNLLLTNISNSYSDIYHKTYHGKKEEMSFESYLDIVKEIYNDYGKIYETIRDINVSLIFDENIKSKLNKYICYLEKEIDKIDDISKEDIDRKDKKLLNELKEIFYNIQHEAYMLRFDSLKLENKIYAEKAHIDNSLV